MSGFEIAGTVLGALPLVIEAAKYYRKIYSRLRDIRENLGELIAALENESVILRNTCELVLEGIAPHHRIQSLIENPLGPDWEPYERRIRSRLWSSLDGIKHRLESMDHACQELKDKLHVKGKQGASRQPYRDRPWGHLLTVY